jgi:phage terminase large subunit-like protein
VRVARRRVDPGEQAMLDLAGAIQALEEAKPRKPQVEFVEAPRDEGLAAPTLSTYRPQPGPQTELETTIATQILFGGAAFGGKSFGVLGCLRDRVKVRGYHAIFFRRSSKQLDNGVKSARAIYVDGQSTGSFAFAAFSPPPLARFVKNGGGGVLHFDAWGSQITFTHLHTDDSYHAHDGQQYDDVIFDEGPEFTRDQVENLSGRRRGTIVGLRRRWIVTANPPEENQDGFEWVHQKWAPWTNPEATVPHFAGLDEGGTTAGGVFVPPTHVNLVGVPERHDPNGKKLPPAMSGQVLYVAKTADDSERFSTAPFMWNGKRAEPRTFIGALMKDNVAGLEAEPNYASNLTMGVVRRQQLELGDWTVRRGKGMMFRREWCRIVDPDEVLPASHIIGDVRCWDKAATEPSTQNPDPNWTRGTKGALVHKAITLRNGETLPAGTILVKHLASCRLGPGERDDFIKTTAEQDGPGVRIRGPQDPGGAGVGDAVAFRSALKGFTVKTETVSGPKVLRFGPASSAAHPASTGGKYGRIAFIRGDWNEVLFAELEGFTGGKNGKDDIVDTLSDLVDELDNHTSVPVKPPSPPQPHNFESQPLGI